MRSHDERRHDPVAEPDKTPAADRDQRLLELAGTIGNAAMQRLAVASTVARKPPPPKADEPEAEDEVPDEYESRLEDGEKYEEKERRRNRVAAKVRERLEDEEPPPPTPRGQLVGRNSLRL